MNRMRVMRAIRRWTAGSAACIQAVLVCAIGCVVGTAHAQAEPDWFTPATIRASDLPADAPRFEQFAVTERFAGKPAAPDVRSHPRSRMFRTMIRAGAQQGPNFAGHYTLVHWGCGSGCSAYAIVDARTGRVFHPANFASIAIYNIDDALTASDERFVRFSLDSRLLMVIGGINEDPALRGISYFVWEGERLRRIRFVPRPDLPDATK